MYRAPAASFLDHPLGADEALCRLTSLASPGSFLNPLLFLAVYVFLYLVVFKTTWPDMTNIGYTVFVFSGLVPFLSFMEVANGSVQLIRSNIHLVKNLVFPGRADPDPNGAHRSGDAVRRPRRCCSCLALIDGQISWNILLLPYLIVIQFLLLVGIAFLCSGFGLLLPDFGYFLGSFLMLMLFLTPIGFKPGMVSGPIEAIVVFNPFTYMVNSFRSAVMGQHAIDLVSVARVHGHLAGDLRSRIGLLPPLARPPGRL